VRVGANHDSICLLVDNGCKGVIELRIRSSGLHNESSSDLTGCFLHVL
jgi:hypothetical protein